MICLMQAKYALRVFMANVSAAILPCTYSRDRELHVSPYPVFAGKANGKIREFNEHIL